MTIMQSVRDALERWGLSDPEIPEGTITVTGHKLLEGITINGREAWNGHRLVANGDTVTRTRGGLFPLVTDVYYLELGEGDEPTVYISTDDGFGCYPLMLDHEVYLIPA